MTEARRDQFYYMSTNAGISGWLIFYYVRGSLAGIALPVIVASYATMNFACWFGLRIRRKRIKARLDQQP